MIATITLNPSVDISYNFDDFYFNEVNRCNNYFKTAGGKGINVTRVLKELNCNVIATGFIGGNNGLFIENELESLSIPNQFTKIYDNTRNCIAINNSDGSQTEILETGPTISEKESNSFLDLITKFFDNNYINVISASGSLPKGLNVAYYNKLIKLANERNIKFVLDTSGEYLSEGIKASPYLIKPNIHEIEQLFNVKITSELELRSILYKLKEFDIKMIVVSLGNDGSIALCDDKLYRINIPKVKVINPVGSGDSMIAGIISEINKNSSFEEILKVGNTCGILNAISKKTGCIDLNKYNEIYKKVKIERIS